MLRASPKVLPNSDGPVLAGPSVSSFADLSGVNVVPSLNWPENKLFGASAGLLAGAGNAVSMEVLVRPDPKTLVVAGVPKILPPLEALPTAAKPPCLAKFANPPDRGVVV